MKFIAFLTVSLGVSMALAPVASAWGPTGHAVIGQAALEQVSPPVRAAVLDLLGVDPGADAGAALSGACNWPDEVREDPQWSWSSPLHYVNLPRSDPRYDRQRDCPDGLCATEGILHYAAALQRPAAVPVPADRRQDSTRWQAFAWLCQLVGDLHQPLHAGFRDDRGGNRVEVTYRGKHYNLHEFWDGVLVRERWSPGDRLPPVTDPAAGPFGPDQPARWTEESHALAIELAYPSAEPITEAFADRSWELILQRWSLAASRLARTLETVLAPSAE